MAGRGIRMIRRTIVTVMAAGLLLVPVTASSASAEPVDDAKCVVKALKEGTGIFWCWAWTPPPP
jgi:hypothetical protein